jgi:hypothetical protein
MIEEATVDAHGEYAPAAVLDACRRRLKEYDDA